MKINFSNQSFGAKITDNEAAKKLRRCLNAYMPGRYEIFCLSVDCILPNDTDIVTFRRVEGGKYPDTDITISGTISRKGFQKDFSVISSTRIGAAHIHRNIIQSMKKVQKKLA